VGLVTRLQKSYKGKEILGTIPQPVSTCLEVLDNLLNQDNTIVSSIVVADKRKKNDVSGSVVEVVANVLGDFFKH
jgi:fatty acid synthase